jgi:hypothetical protein
MPRTTIAALLLLLAVQCHKAEQPRVPTVAVAPTNAIESLPSPTGIGAAEPFLSATRDGVILSWLEPVADSDRIALRMARFRNDQWSATRTVIERNDLFANWADFPSILEDARGTLFAHWLQRSGSDTYSYDVRMASSIDGGATWSAPFLLNRDGKQSEHGFASLAALSNGGVAATWLDGRNMTAAHGEDEEMGGDMTVRFANVDANGVMSEEAELDARTCECCTTGMAMTASGPLIVYRDRSQQDIRDIFALHRDARGWSAPRAVRVDGWKLDGCPVNGPQADAIGDHAATAWFTAANERQRVYAAFSTDGGATFGDAITIDDGKPIGRVDLVLLDERTALVTWLEQTNAGAEIRARRVSIDGTRTPSMKIADASSARAAGFTRIARSGAHVWFAWTEQDATKKQVRLARMRM